jgi:hypothetical protein
MALFAASKAPRADRRVWCWQPSAQLQGCMRSRSLRTTPMVFAFSACCSTSYCWV